MPKSPALVATLAATDLAAACAELAERDATLGRLIARVGPFGLEPRYIAAQDDGLAWDQLPDDEPFTHLKPLR